MFNFPMPIKGKEITALPLESEATVETVVSLSLNSDSPEVEASM